RGGKRAAGNRCGRRGNVGSAVVLNLWGAEGIPVGVTPPKSLRTEKKWRGVGRRMRVRAWAASERRAAAERRAASERWLRPKGGCV
ncbi:hypothetical protein, partial [Alistipes sp.]|uniref:hypothetical protein n=1 Tax=Alistipes sp. TaxID=1872444 RepID=UPI003AB28421